MTPKDAWVILAEQTERPDVQGVHSPLTNDDRLASLTALAVLAEHIGLIDELAAVKALLRALRECDARQLRFREMRRSQGSGNHDSNGGDGRS